MLYIGTDSNRVYAINTSGGVVWSCILNGAISSSPAIGGDVVYVGTWYNDHKIYALNCFDGSFIWSYALPNNVIITGMKGINSPTLANGKLMVTSDTGNGIFVFDPEKIEKSVDKQTASPSEMLNYTISVYVGSLNSSNSSIEVQDTLSGSLSFISQSISANPQTPMPISQFTQTGQVLRWNITNVQPYSTITIHLQTQINYNAGVVIHNHAMLKKQGGGAWRSSQTVCTDITVNTYTPTPTITPTATHTPTQTAEPMWYSLGNDEKFNIQDSRLKTEKAVNMGLGLPNKDEKSWEKSLLSMREIEKEQPVCSPTPQFLTSQLPISSTSKFVCYPNPAKDMITIVLPDEVSGNVEVSIYDVTAKKIKNLQLKSSQFLLVINTSDLSNGIYICVVKTEENFVSNESKESFVVLPPFKLAILR